MHTHRNFFKNEKGLLHIILALITLTVLTSCGLPSLGTGGESLRETSIALGVQSTSNALRESTLQALQTSAALPTQAPAQQVNLQATLNAQMTAIAQQSTLAAPTAVVSAPATDTASAPTAAAQVSEILLTKWEPLNLHSASECNNEKRLNCWDGSGYELALVLNEPLLVDPAWERPFLVFSHTYSFQAMAYLYAIVDGRNDLLHSYDKGEKRWYEVALDLSKYKGKEIELKFYINGPTMKSANVWWKSDQPAPSSRWSIQNIRVVPNYTK